MANSLFKQFGGKGQNGAFNGGIGRFGNPQKISTMIQKFMQFRKAFKGDAKAQVKTLLDTGKITQEELDEVMGVANQIVQIIPFFKRQG